MRALPALQRRGPTVDPHVRRDLYKLQEQRAEAWAGAELDAAVFALAGEGAPGTVLTGWPVAELRRRSAEREAGLLVSGTSARRGLQHTLHGSVYGAIAAEAPCPVVAVPPDAVLTEPGPVLVGDDGSEHARRAIRHAEALAARVERELLRLQVEDGDPRRGAFPRCPGARASLAVAGTRGRGSLRGQLLGSVSTGLVRTAGRPVVLVSQRAGSPP